MVGILITVLVAALVYLLLVAITGSTIVGLVAAILILIAGIPSGGFGFGSALRRARSALSAQARAKPEVGLEPTTCALQERCSTN